MAKKIPAGPESELLARLRTHFAKRSDVVEKKMFGGWCFLVQGNMCCGLTGSGDLMVRVGPAAYSAALKLEHARPMDLTGTPMKGFVFVAAEGIRTGADLTAWLNRGVAYAESLPPQN